MKIDNYFIESIIINEILGEMRRTHNKIMQYGQYFCTDVPQTYNLNKNASANISVICATHS